MYPPDTAATSLVPSAEDASASQYRLSARCVQLVPEFVEVYRYPPDTAATSFVPSADDATALQDRDSKFVSCAQLLPESVEV